MSGWHITADGDRLIVTGVNREWLTAVIRSAQASDAVRALTPPPVDGIDPIVAELRQIRTAKGVTSRAMRDALHTRIDRHENGHTQPTLGLLRPWAWLLQHDVVLRPQEARR